MSAKNNRQQVGRVAFRLEGDCWNAYYAQKDSMKDAIFLGSISLLLIMKSEKNKNAFMDLMRDSAADMIADNTGVKTVFGKTIISPEHEKSGHG